MATRQSIALLVHTARGPVVDYEALYSALSMAQAPAQRSTPGRGTREPGLAAHRR